MSRRKSRMSLAYVTQSLMGLTVATLGVFSETGFAQTVTNVRATQLGDKSVEVLYDLSGAVAGGTRIEATFSNDGGATWSIKPSISTLFGDVGTVMTGGANRRIVWSASETLPPNTYGSAFKAAIAASSLSGDRCTSAAIGQRITILGDEYVLVDVEVVLQDSPDRYALRYPVRFQGEYKIMYVTSPIFLASVCTNEFWECLYPCVAGSICGYGAVFCPDSRVSGSYTGGTNPLHLSWECGASAREYVAIRVDSSHERIWVSFSHSESVKTPIANVSEFNYSFISAKYPCPSFDTATWLSQLDLLMSYISLRKL